MAAFVDWDVAKNFGRLTSGESGVWRPDLKAAGYFGIKQFWQDMNFLDEGQWHQGDAGDNVLESLVYTTYLDTPFFGNVLDGNDGDDRLVGYAGNDALRGGKGADILEGQNGDDVLKGGPGQDRAIFQSVTWFSSKWNDAVTELITTKHKANRPVTVDLAKSGPQDTGYGLDTLISIEHVTSGSRNDKLMGNAGANSLVSGGGNDRIWGRDGDDRLNGGKNNDKIFGGNGDDQLVGGSGKDILRGDGGKDRMSGGAGADLFVFTKISDSAATKAGADLITDFRQGLDRIDLQAIDASKQLSGNNAFTFDGTKPFGTSRKGDIYFKQVDNAGTKNDFTLGFIDTDSDRDAEMMLKLNGLFTLTAGDFIL
jgi:Ca2+-binding RTX toxin-like protein